MSTDSGRGRTSDIAEYDGRGPGAAARIGVPWAVIQKGGLVPTKRRERVKNTPGVYKSISGSYEIAYRDSDGRQVFRTLPKGTSLKEAKLERANSVSRLGRGETERRAPQRFHDYAVAVIGELDRAPRTIEKHEYHLSTHLETFKSSS